MTTQNKSQIGADSLTSHHKILNLKQLSTYTGISESWLYKLVQQHRIPYSRPNGKLLFFDREKIDAWLLSNPVEPGDDIEAEAINYIANNPWKGGLL